MDEVSQKSLSRARTIRNTIVTAVQNAGRTPVADAIGVDVSYIAKLINDDSDHKLKFKNLGILLELCGLKVVPVEYQCIDPKRYKLLKELADLGAETIRDDQHFALGEPEDVK